MKGIVERISIDTIIGEAVGCAVAFVSCSLPGKLKGLNGAACFTYGLSRLGRGSMKRGVCAVGGIGYGSGEFAKSAFGSLMERKIQKRIEEGCDFELLLQRIQKAPFSNDLKMHLKDVAKAELQKREDESDGIV